MEEIRPLPLWSNIFGLLPLAAKQEDERKHKILQKSLLLWCSVVFLLQLLELSAVLYILWRETWMALKSSELTSTLTVIANQLSAILSNFLPRFICWRSKHFKRSLDHLKHFLVLAGKQDGTLPSIRKQILRGFFVGFVWFVADFALVLSYVTSAAGNEGKTLHYLVLVTRCVSYGHQIFTYVSLYAIVSLLAQRITVIQQQFQQITSRAEKEPCISETVAFQNYLGARASRSFYRNGQGKTIQIKLIRKLLARVHWAGEELVHTFSPILILMLILKLITIITMLIHFAGWLLYLINSPRAEFDPTAVAYLMVQLAINITILLVVFHVADIPVQKMSTLRNCIADYDAQNLTLEEKTDLNILIQSVSPERVQLTAGGLFGIGKHLLPGITGTIVTYIVILMQAGGAQWKN